MSEDTKRIKLIVENAGGVDRIAWPITQGVPFADENLEKGAPVRIVDGDGRTLPTQSTCLATWNRDLKYVKWLLVDFQADLKADTTETLFLEYGPGVEEATPEQGVTISQDDNRLRVDTGAIRLDFRRASGFRRSIPSIQATRDFLSGCWIKTEEGWHDVFQGKPGPYLYMVDVTGKIYDSCTTAPPPRVTVEDAGPMRVSVCVKGHHASSDGVRLCPYTLRIHAYAGKSDLRFFHTFVFDQNPEEVAFSEVGMFFPLDIGDDLRMAFGGQEKAHWATRWEHGQFFQSSDLSYHVSRDQEPYGEGEKTRGWASLCGSKASAFVAIRDFWQQYPKGYELTPEGIDIQLWPGAYDEPLVFSTPWQECEVFFSGQFGDLAATCRTRDEAAVKQLIEANPTAPLNLKSFDVHNLDDVRWVEEMVEKYAPDRTASHNDTGLNDGSGAGKTHEFVVRFSPEPIDDTEAETLGICVQEPVIAPADPAYMYGTHAARDVFGGPDPRFEELDTLMDGVTERVAIEPMHLGRAWGFWRFGNMCCSHSASPGLAWLLHYHTDPVKGLRYVGHYNNEADNPCWGLWTQFLRTGNRRFFLAASGHSRAMGEVGICHAHSWNPEAVGVMHYHNAHQWTGSYSPSHTLNLALFLHYYFTGNRRMREIALEPADWAVRHQEDAGIISCRNGVLNREFTGPLNCVIEAFLDTWAMKYEDLARRSLNWLLRAQESPGVWPRSVFTRGDRGDELHIDGEYAPLNHGGILYPIFYEGLRHFDSPLLRETIIAEADMGSTTACAIAYELTGDPIYAARCKKAALSYSERARGIVELDEKWCDAFFSGIRNGLFSVYKAIGARAEDKDPAAFAEAEKKLEALERSRPKKEPRTGPREEGPDRKVGIIDVHDS